MNRTIITNTILDGSGIGISDGRGGGRRGVGQYYVGLDGGEIPAGG